MAEAVVEERSQVPTRFYCHMCNVEINIPNTDFTCPLCSGGFIEELPANTPPLSSQTSSTSAHVADHGVGAGTSGDGQEAARFNDLEAIRGEIATLLMSRNGPNVEISIDAGNRRGNLLSLGNSQTGSSISGLNTGSGGGGTGGGRVRQQNYDRLDNVLMDFLQSISGDVDTPQMFFMGNPGDYAWGREGIDTIVTQLLNQMETSGPPPLAKDKIDEIPKVEITSDEVDKKLQCSVCWEDFRLQEIVRKLPCLHIYHENCIVPWLDLHGTCPICRKSLAGDIGDEHSDTNSENLIECPMHSNNSTAAAVGAEQVLNRNTTSTVINGAANSSNLPAVSGLGRQRSTVASGTSRNAAAGNQTQTQQNNIFAFDDGNVDLD